MQVPPATEVSPSAQSAQAPPAAGDDLPALHSVQSATTLLPAGDDFPAPQGEHVMSPAAAYLPTTHVAQVPPATEVSPSAQSAQAPLAAGDDLPAPQSMQVPTASAPAAAEYLPATQSIQVPTESAPAAAEYLPAPQSLQAEASVSSLYLPAPHASQAPSSAVVLPLQPWPTTQVWVVWFPQVPPATEYVPAPQSVQSSKASLPSGDDVPAPQSLQAEASVSSLYLPAPHASQAPSSAVVEPAQP